MRRCLTPLILVIALFAGPLSQPAHANALSSRLTTESVWTFERHYATSRGLPYPILAVITLAESGGDPNAGGIDSNGYGSWGLLGLNQAGQGAGYSAAYLVDPRHNLDLGVPPIRRAYGQRPGGLSGYDLVAWVASWSGHNASNGTSVDSDLGAAYNTYLAGRLTPYQVTVHDPLARPFPLGFWTSWTRAHHRPPVPHKRLGHLRLTAAFWAQHPERYGAPIHRSIWHPAIRPHGAGYMSTWFQRAGIVCWPEADRCRCLYRIS